MTVVLLCVGNNLFAQADVVKVTPLSPNAAAIAKYGEMPVSHFTGVPNISIPIHTVQSKTLTLPIQLSYHAGGNRVETIASWVGMGWSLSPEPTISRTVRGIPDEGADGFFNKFGGKSVMQIYTDWYTNPTPTNVTAFTNFLILARDNTVDTEADVFSYSIGGRSGQFFFDQVTMSFRATPHENFDISYNSTTGAFTIVTDDGTRYIFWSKDKINTMTDMHSSLFTNTTWHADMIIDANRVDTLKFHYLQETHFYRNIVSSTKYQLVAVNCPPSNNPQTETNASTTYATAQLLNKITYSGGETKFIRGTTMRLDLDGGYPLEAVEVKLSDGTVLSRYEFSYSYLTGSGTGFGCAPPSTEPSFYSQERRWMLLDSVNHIAGTEKLSHAFIYDQNYVPPCRLSYSQDYWGYFNDKGTNTMLIPTEYMDMSTPGNVLVVKLEGADRSVDPSRSQFGMLKKIIYPTGGFSEFIYENHQVSEDDEVNVPRSFVYATASIEPEETITTDEYSTPFQIDNQPYLYLNGGHPDGGAFVNIYADYFGCDLSAGASPCANVFIQGTSPENSDVYVQITGEQRNVHLPNGNYLLKATFEQDPPMYGNFFVTVIWQEMDTTVTNQYVGGLRIKEIKTHDGVSTLNDRITQYKYTEDISSNNSSGNILGNQFFTYKEIVEYQSSEYLAASLFCETCSALYMRLKSYSSYNAVSQGGSFVGYRSVTENSGDNGFTEYKFSLIKDEQDNLFPYPPAVNYEFARGLPTEINTFKKNGNTYIKVKRIKNEYNSFFIDSYPAFGLKTGLRSFAISNCASPPSNLPEFKNYNFFPAKSLLLKSKEIVYSQMDSMVQVTDYAYTPDLYQTSSVTTVDSKGTVNTTLYEYPADTAQTEISVDARSEMLSRNILTPVLRQEIRADEVSIQTVLTNYRIEDTGDADLVVPDRIYVQAGIEPTEERVEFIRYNSGGKILEQKRSDDVPLSYIWDEIHGLLLAEVTNATSDNIYHSSFEVSGTSETVSNPAHTGTRYLNTGSYNFSSNGFVPGSTTNLKMSYWYWSSSKWNFSGIVNWSNTISAGTRLDEIRVFPAEAQMITYTHAPGIGITSQTDANNVTTYYEYDSFGRLKWLRDKDKNIVKRIDYHYRKTN